MKPERRLPRADRPRIKVCGVTRVEDALRAARLGADMIGLNFYPPSPRYLEIEAAREIAEAVRTRATGGGSEPPLLVGVFVNEAPETVARIDSAVGLDLLQMHGDEQPADVWPVRARAIKALRVAREFDPDTARRFLDQGGPEGEGLWGFLIDTKHPELYGGSGQSWSFASLAGVQLGRPVLIAGGLDPDNVRTVIEAAQPWGIDVCSGVESAPGIKDPDLLARFFEETFHVTSAVAS